ncbi:MAG: hypothetical protein DMG65_00420 [Candidatus Angelobacter sp. Gp1-AA117]|nr:MAG: hypothetical protein DMG65_00420 [Candidatus Angelobacter sp. Gp1-AA117]
MTLLQLPGFAGGHFQPRWVNSIDIGPAVVQKKPATLAVKEYWLVEAGKPVVPDASPVGTDGPVSIARSSFPLARVYRPQVR